MKENKYNGLGAAEVEASRQEHGCNVLTPPKKASLWLLYIEKYRDPIIRILLVAAAISLVLAFIENQFVETIGIFFAIFLATTVGFVFEMDAAKKFDVLTQLNEEQMVKVRRDGKVTTVARKDIVVGDVVIIETGDEVPADGRLIEATNLQIDESSLTGESLSTKTPPQPSPQGRENTLQPFHQGREDSGASTYDSDFVLRSSMVMNGNGVFVVTAVGDATEIGKVARTSSEQNDVKTPLNLQLERLGGVINKIGFSLSFLAFAAFLLHDILVNPLWHSDNYFGMLKVVLEYFMMAVTLIVMAVPEGLPMAVTLSLALNMRRMLKSNNLVRKLHACETMGAVTVICTDKTGTLTQNKMKVVASLQLPPKEGETDSNLLYEAIAVNSTAHLGDDGKGIGNPTEVALLQWLKDKGQDYRQLRQECTIVEQIPFSTETKQMKTKVRLMHNLMHNSECIMHNSMHNSECIMHNSMHNNDTEVQNNSELCIMNYEFLKGAPEIVLSQCSMSDDERREVEDILLSYQRKAMRTLALAVALDDNKKQTADTCNTFKLQAVFGIADPIREDVPDAVRQCNDAGIEVKIVTGDVDATACEIARQINLMHNSECIMHNIMQNSEFRMHNNDTDAQNNYELCIMNSELTSISGAEFSALSDEEAMKVARSIKVMSRARPQDKQRLVQLLQRSGAVVAVTGDGTNDAPALNYAHVGLSLGSGTNVAKEASDMTLLDDSFASIARAVMWGRSLYHNLQRFLFFQLVVNVVALLLVIGGSVIGTEMPLTVTQILWVNLIMDTFAALALSSLPPSREVMKETPRKQTDFILTTPIIRGILVTGISMFIVMFALLIYCETPHNGMTGEGLDVHELTLFFTTFVMMQVWNLLNAKCIGSKHSAFRRLHADTGLLFVLFCTVAGQWLIVTFGGEMFRCVPLSAMEWLGVIVFTSPVLIIGEIYRCLQRR